MTLRQRCERHIFSELLQMVPNLETHLKEGGNVMGIADLVCHDLSFDNGSSLNAIEDPKRHVKC